MYLQTTLLLAATLGIAGCVPKAGTTAVDSGHPQNPTTQAAQQYRLTATIQDLMEAVIDPSADVLWDSVAYIATKQGVEDRRPRTAEEWKTVRNSAITLVEAANLLSMPGRTVSSRGGTLPGPGELSHAEIQQLIAAGHEGFVQLARNLQDAGLQALAAIDAKDAPALMDAGGTIDAACEACHVTFWYPGQQQPGS